MGLTIVSLSCQLQGLIWVGSRMTSLNAARVYHEDVTSYQTLADGVARVWTADASKVGSCRLTI